LTTAMQTYRNMIKEHECSHCWACGRTGEYFDKPKDWNAAWWLERAHIVNKPRIEDRRLCVILCSLCHAQAGGARIITSARPADWPALSRPNLLWLKLEFDPEYYDREFLQAHMVGKLPRASRPPLCYLNEYERRHAA